MKRERARGLVELEYSGPELGFAFLEEGRGPFSHLLTRGTNAEERRFEEARVVEGQIETVVDGFNAMRHRQRAVGKDGLQKSLDIFSEFLRITNRVDETDSLSFLGTHVAPGEQNLERPAPADEPRQTLGARVARDQTELDLGLP
jgi:hypothetical protein